MNLITDYTDCTDVRIAQNRLNLTQATKRKQANLCDRSNPLNLCSKDYLTLRAIQHKYHLTLRCIHDFETRQSG